MKIFSIFVFLYTSCAIGGVLDCYKVVDFEARRHDLKPYSRVALPPFEGIVGGVENSYELLQASKLELRELKKLSASQARQATLKLQIQNLQSRFHPWDLVILNEGGEFDSRNEYKVKNRSLRVYKSGSRINYFITQIRMSERVDEFPLMLELDSDCKIQKFHYLHHASFEKPKPLNTFHSRTCSRLDHIDTVAPLITMNTVGMTEKERCRMVGGIQKDDVCRCKRQSSKIVFPPYEVCNVGEARRQGRRALASIESAQGESLNRETFTHFDYSKLSRACHTFQKFLAK